METPAHNETHAAAGQPARPAEPAAHRRSMLRDPVPWLTLIVVFAVDQLTKWLVVKNLARFESWPEEGFFRFTHAHNTGTAFGLFQGQGGILTFVSLAAVVVLFFVYRSASHPPFLVRAAFGLQLGGAFGNLFDRIRIGHVTDFIDVGPWPIFNIADSAIVTGIVLMFVYLTRTNASDESASDRESTADRPGIEGQTQPSTSAEPGSNRE